MSRAALAMLGVTEAPLAGSTEETCVHLTKKRTCASVDGLLVVVQSF